MTEQTGSRVPGEGFARRVVWRLAWAAVMILVVAFVAGNRQALFGLLPAGPPEAEALPNIVLIISDDQGWTDHGFMGHPVIRTPALDRLASESMVYSRGYVPTSLCRPSLATMMTGLYPHQHGITGNDPDGAMMDPPNRSRMVDIFKRSKTVAGLLAEKGYVSHQSGKWWEGECQCGGFTACMTHGDPARGGRHGDDGLAIGRETMQPMYDFIEGVGGKPFFLWYAPFLPHEPHNPPERLLAKYRSPDRPLAVARYYAMCEWLDETVGQLLGFLAHKGLQENTVVLYVVDNGWVQMADRELWYQGRAKASPYDAGLRTPVTMRWPGKVAPGRDETTLVSSIDLAPTILRAAGIEPPEEMPGIDLRDRAKLTARQAIYGSLFAHTAVDVDNPVANLKYRWMIRDGWKLILPYEPNRDVELMINGYQADWMRFEPELYHVADDPHETKNLAADEPERVESLRQELDGWWAVPKG